MRYGSCNKCVVRQLQNGHSGRIVKRRATATLLRCREKENLEIIVGNLNDIQFDKKFDYITLIGVFEYQGCYTESDNPYKDFFGQDKAAAKARWEIIYCY